MFYLDSNNTKHYVGRALTHGEGENAVQYPPSSVTHDLLVNTLGYTPVTIQTRPDDRFYIVTGPDTSGAYSSTAKDLDEVKQVLIRQTKLSARGLLAVTDWLVVRKEENGNGIPQAVLQFRDNVRSISDDNCTLINGCTTIAELETLVKAPTQIDDTSNPGSMIANTDPHLAEYPEPVSGYDY